MPNENISAEALDAAVKSFRAPYQPIYGHPEYDNRAVRACVDRLQYIHNVYDALSKELGRPLRVLEFGCAQGFMSFTMASWGAEVVGIDSARALLDIWKILINENPNLKVTFVLARLEKYINEIEAGKYDLVLGLSIFHHLCNLYGWQKVQEILTYLSKRITAGIFEMALNTEPIDSAKTLPEDYRELLTGFSCVKLLAYNQTHLPNVKRPLVFASNNYVFFEKAGMLKINQGEEPDDYVYQPERRYFFCGNKFVKCARILTKKDMSKHLEPFQRECQFLSKWGGVEDFPVLYAVDMPKYETEREIWIARDKIDGVPLSIAIQNHEDFDKWDVIRQILRNFIFLEEHNYYHADLSHRNFLYDKDTGKIFLIDYGAIRKFPDCDSGYFDIHRHTVFIFFSLVREFLAPELSTIRPRIFTTVSGALFLKQYLTQAQYVKLLSVNVEKKIFTQIYEILFLSEDTEEPKAVYNLRDYELLEIEYLLEGVRNDRHANCMQFLEYFRHYGQIISNTASLVNGLLATVEDQQKRIAALEKIIEKQSHS